MSIFWIITFISFLYSSEDEYVYVMWCVYTPRHEINMSSEQVNYARHGHEIPPRAGELHQACHTLFLIT